MGLFAESLLQSHRHLQAVTAAVEDARVISRLTAVRDIGSENSKTPLTTTERADLDGDVTGLTGGGDLLNLSIWREDGDVLYSGGVVGGTFPVTPARLVNVLFFDATSPKVPRTAAITVVLHAAISKTGPPLLVGVTIPDKSIEGSQSSSSLLSLLTLIAVLIAGAALVMMRGRLRQRTYQANHDGLTRLGNRMLLERTANGLFEASEPFALLTMDFDGFKRVNDSLGHAAGDDLLVLVAGALRGCIRPQDLLVRLGGDEFAVLMPGLTAPHLEAAANRLLGGVRRQFTARGVDVDCDASVGAALAPQDGSDFGQLLQAADIAMYQAKRGKLGVRVFADSDEEVNADDLRTLVDLRGAIEAGQLVLHYQPVAVTSPRLGSDDGSYLEALVRWQHPTCGLIPPDRFVPLAEDTALIHPMTEWVLNEAVRQCASWRLDGLDTTVAVNISPRSLTDPGLVGIVLATLARHQLPASALHLEITESAVISRPELARDILTQLAGLGICISIDDFGTGYTSLAHLKTLPIETLKIDRCFVSDLLTDHSDEVVVASVINLGHGLGMHVIAEGVEDQATLRRLGELGCDRVQGFHLSRALTATAATAWLRRQAHNLEVALN